MPDCTSDLIGFGAMTMNTIYHDAEFTDEVVRQLLYDGQLFVCSPRPSSMAVCEFAEADRRD